jgi:hypothetical protein
MNELVASRLGKPGHRHWAAGLSLGIVLLCIYYPVFTHRYLYHDDWLHFSTRVTPCSVSPMSAWSEVAGRAIGQYVLCGLFSVFPTTDEAWIARTIVVGGIVLFAFLQWMYFETLGLSWGASLLLALGTSTLPGVLVISYWITAGSHIFAYLASVVAALLTEAALPLKNRYALAALIASACGLQIVALLTYQTAAMYFWTLTAVMLATRLPRGLRTAAHTLAGYAFVGAVPMAGYFIWFEYISGLAADLARQDPLRGTIFPDVATTASWFLHAALPRASSLWFLDPPRGFGFAVLIFFFSTLTLPAVSMGFRAWRTGAHARSVLYALYPLVIAILGLLAFSPMLVASFHYEVFRSLIPLSALIFLTAAVHLGMIFRADLWPKSIRIGVVMAITLGLSCLAVNSLLGRMVLPAASEYAFFRSSLLDATRNGHAAGRVHVIVPMKLRELRTDEFDNLSAQRVQDIGPMIQVMSRELALQLSPPSFSFQGEPFDHEGTLILDLAELSKSGLWKSLLGSIEAPSPPIKSDIVNFQPPDPTDPLPRLLSSYHSYNLVAYRGRIYGLPQSMGPRLPVEFSNGTIARLPYVIVGSTVEEVLARLP